jgi:hypothetical protein
MSAVKSIYIIFFPLKVACLRGLNFFKGKGQSLRATPQKASQCPVACRGPPLANEKRFSTFAVSVVDQFFGVKAVSPVLLVAQHMHRHTLTMEQVPLLQTVSVFFIKIFCGIGTLQQRKR